MKNVTGITAKNHVDLAKRRKRPPYHVFRAKWSVTFVGKKSAKIQNPPLRILERKPTISHSRRAKNRKNPNFAEELDKLNSSQMNSDEEELDSDAESEQIRERDERIKQKEIQKVFVY